MNIPDKDFCSLAPLYPRHAYMTYLFVMEGGETSVLIPLTPVFHSKKDISFWVSDAVKGMDREWRHEIHDTLLLFPISFESLFPLKREYWARPSLRYGVENRLRGFIPVVHQPFFYKLLVTPACLDADGDWHLDAAIPLFGTSGAHVIEKFMLTTDLPVEERAKSSAIYTFQNPVYYNWRTQEITSADNDLTRWKSTNSAKQVL